MTDIPAAVAELMAGQPLRLVWKNRLGGLTYETGAGAGRRFVKWAPAASGADLGTEAAKLRWAGRWSRVPEVLDEGADGEGAWLVTAALTGVNAVDDRWRAEPATAVAAIGEGLRALHEALPVQGCPFPYSWPGEGEEGVPPVGVDRLVVCHGDACAPNTLLAEDGRWSGHVDLGALGVADRWADLAIATLSAEWNYGPGWEPLLLEAYGVAADPERTGHYRRLWDLTP